MRRRFGPLLLRVHRLCLRRCPHGSSTEGRSQKLPSGSCTTHCCCDFSTKRATIRFVPVFMLYSSGAWLSRAHVTLTRPWHPLSPAVRQHAAMPLMPVYEDDDLAWSDLTGASRKALAKSSPGIVPLTVPCTSTWMPAPGLWMKVSRWPLLISTIQPLSISMRSCSAVSCSLALCSKPSSRPA
jgi:hypothetical protein